jgi:dienelactone hydrolase
MFSLFKRKKNTAVTETAFSTVRQGLTIRGTELRPEGDRLPAAIVCHGFMATQGTVRQYAMALAEEGYAAYIFDFCGGSAAFGKSDGETTEMSVLTEVADLEAVIAHVRSLPYVDADHLLLAGASQGGFVSALTAAKHPDAVEKLILIYPALCIPDDARRGQMMFAHFDPANIPATFWCGPMKLGRCYPEAVLRMDPFSEIAPHRGRVLLIHGTADDLVKPEYSQRAKEAYAASCPEGMPLEERVQLHLIEGGGHGFNEQQDQECIGCIKAFVQE